MRTATARRGRRPGWAGAGTCSSRSAVAPAPGPGRVAGAADAASWAADTRSAPRPGQTAYALQNWRLRKLLLGPEELVGWSEGFAHSVAVTASGAVYCRGSNVMGQLGTGEDVELFTLSGSSSSSSSSDEDSDSVAPQAGFRPARLPWPAAEASAGWYYTVARRADGPGLCSWGDNGKGQLGRSGRWRTPREVPGLPEDPIAVLGTGKNFTIVVTSRDEAFSWGENEFGQLATGERGAPESRPVRAAGLCGRQVCRIACGGMLALAETSEESMLVWGAAGMVNSARPRALGTGGVGFPLQGLAAGYTHGVAADAQGAAWVWEVLEMCHGRPGPLRVALPEGERAARVAAAFSAVTVVMTERGTLWDCSLPQRCRSISAAHPELPLGLSPFGGCSAQRVVCAPCGYAPPPERGVLRIGGRDLQLDTLLSDAGVAAELEVELLQLPPVQVPAAAEGSLPVFVRAPALGRPDPVCVEVEPGATVGGLAALAAQQMGLLARPDGGEGDGDRSLP